MRNPFWTLLALTTMSLAAFAMAPQTVTLDVQNMTCAVCPITVLPSTSTGHANGSLALAVSCMNWSIAGMPRPAETPPSFPCGSPWAPC